MKKQSVELYRFIMTIAICLHHFRLYSETVLPYGGGYLAVDFFFILSGFFLYEHSQRCLAINIIDALKKTVIYTKHRYQRLFPQYVFILIISMLMYTLVMGVHINMFEPGALVSKFLMIDGIYLHSQVSVMPQGWYCSSLLFGSALVYFLNVSFKKRFIKELAPILIIVIYTVLFFKYGNLNLYTQYGFIITVGCFRCIAGLCVGCVLSSMVGRLDKSFIKSIWISIVLLGIFTAIILYALLWNRGYNRSDYAILVVFVVILYFLLDDNSIIVFLDRHVFGILGEISYTMFLVHHLIAVLFDYFDWFRNCDWKIVSLVYLVVVVVCSFIVNKIVEMSKIFGYQTSNKYMK